MRAGAALIDEIQVYDDDINAPRVFGLELHLNGTPDGRSHILPLERQANSLFAVIDTQLKGFGLNFGVGRGLTGSADKWTVKAIFAIPL